MRIALDLDGVWAAGLFEGEGCITRTGGQGGKYYIQLKLAMIDEDVVKRFAEWASAGTLRHRPPQSEGWQSQWVWQTSTQKEVHRIMEALYPYLGKRRQARYDELRGVI